MSVSGHQEQATDLTPRCAVVTLSDTRTQATDLSGAAIRRYLNEAGCALAAYELLPDEPQRLQAALNALLGDDGIDAVICNGGTGISKRDRTIEVVAGFIETPLPGFGEIFRQQSFLEIGPAAMLSRAAAGVARGRMLFALPGSTPAVELAMRLITPVLRHLVFELRK
ncbi:MAG TPA: MogA/MoaB family molybdenum cofactor biosynthesis protein [Tepidisphaeraceae bacterium]|jgi:molybdenum cofactor biosynthesis protein B